MSSFKIQAEVQSVYLSAILHGLWSSKPFFFEFSFNFSDFVNDIIYYYIV